MKIKTLLPLLMVFISAKLLSSENIIAYNHDKTIVLTKVLLNDWLELNQPYKLHDRETQINSYFLEKALLKKIDLIPKNKLKEIEFNHNRLLYGDSFAIFKKEIVSKIEIDKEQYELLLTQLKQKNEVKKDKVRLYQIFKKYPKGADDHVKEQFFKQMQSIRKLITDLDSFKNIAQQESDSQSRLRRGLIGNVHHGLLPEKLNDIVMNMKEGELGNILKSPDGLMLFFCEKRIPVKKFTEKEMKKNVTKTMMPYYVKKEWNHFYNKIVDELNIEVDFAQINTNNQNIDVAKSKEFVLSIQEAKWLLNKSDLTQVKEKYLVSSIKNYFVSKYLFKQLNNKQRNEIVGNNHHNYIRAVTATVILQLINKTFQPPQELNLQQYYKANSNRFIRKKHFDISYITFDLKEGDEQAIYNSAFSVLSFLMDNQNNFDELSTNILVGSKKYEIKRIKSIAENKLASFLGLDVAKQINLMKKNEISKLVKSDNGLLWVVRLNNIEVERKMTFEEASTIIDKELGVQMLKKHENKIIDDILSKQQITFVTDSE